VVEQLKSAPERLLQAPEHALRFLRPHKGLGSAFGDDWFGQFAERLARIFGTPKYIFGQTVVVIFWILFNGYSIFVHFDPYPFILLNLAFSTQAAYAAPLILLAQTRQAERDKVLAEADAEHREALAHEGFERQESAAKQNEALHRLLEQNTDLTQATKKLAERIDTLTAEVHEHVCKNGDG
jgi:uncharacterized membrane protein